MDIESGTDGFEQDGLFPPPPSVPRAPRRRVVSSRQVQVPLELDPPPERSTRKRAGPRWPPFVLLPNDPDL